MSNSPNHEYKSPGMRLNARGLLANRGDGQLPVLQSLEAGLFPEIFPFGASVRRFGRMSRVPSPCAKTSGALLRGDSLNRICFQRS